VPGHMRDGGEVAMLGGIVAELLAVAKLRLRQTMHPPAGLARLDDGRYVKSVPVDGDAAFDNAQGQALRLQIAIVDGGQGGQLCAGGMAHDEKSLGIAAVFGDVVMDPADGLGDIANNSRHVDARQEPVVGGNEYEPFVHENFWLQLDARFIAGLPTAAVNP